MTCIEKASNQNEYKTMAYIKLIEEALSDFLVGGDKLYSDIIDAMQYSTKNGGKRIRPVLLLEFCRVLSHNFINAIPFAVALEMIHCYSLIHDDLPCMDNDELRRGKPSCHKMYDESTALLAGDALLTKAFEIMATSPLAKSSNADNVRHAMRAIGKTAYYSGVDGMIGGQVLDLKYEGKPVDEIILNTTHKLKTCALIKIACVNGAIIGGANEDTILKAKEYATYLGLAFQIVDDILDVTSTTEVLGKPVGSDVQSGKNTFVTLYGIEKANELAVFYTDSALKILDDFDDNTYLRYLTKKLLSREN